MTTNVKSLPPRKPNEITINLDDENVITLASSHLSTLTRVLSNAQCDAVKLTNHDVAELLWPLTEIMTAASNRHA